MGNNQHLKRHTTSKSYPIKRKNITFVAKPKPGSFKKEYVIPLVVAIRDILKFAKTSKEVKEIVFRTEEVLINGKKVVDLKFPLGILDILEFKKLKKKFILIFGKTRKFFLKEVKDNLIYLKVSDKKIVAKNKLQLNFFNGYNFFVDKKIFKDIRVGDTIVYDFSSKKIVKELKEKKGNFVYFYEGKFKSKYGKILDILKQEGKTKELVLIEDDKKLQHKTLKKYSIVIGEKVEEVKRFIE